MEAKRFALLKAEAQDQVKLIEKLFLDIEERSHGISRSVIKKKLEE